MDKRKRKKEDYAMRDAKIQGLSDKEVKKLLKENGENRLEEKGKTPALYVFAGQFRDQMVLILLAATAVSAMLGEVGEALTIAVIVLLNALIGFFQEYSTEKTLESLSKLAAPAAHVIRNGREEWIDATNVVCGDILVIEAGDRVAADGVILECVSFSCDEAMLTGESVPEQKHPDTGRWSNAEDAHSAMVFMGTNAVTGRAVVRVTATGMATQMGAIAGMLGDIEDEQTPLQKRLAQIGKTIGIGCIVICSVVAVTGILRGEEPLSMLLVGISLAVAAVPEGLPAIVTVSLALAVRRILKRNALVKKLHAVETLGCTRVICSDKTGTLTQNRMTVERVFTCRGETDISQKSEAVKRILECAAYCNDAKIENERQSFLQKHELRATGEPTECALILAAAQNGISKDEFERVSEMPFDSDRKRMSVTGICKDGTTRTYLKGAPEIVLKRCTHAVTAYGIKPLDENLRRKILKANEDFASNALRVLAFASKEGGDNPEEELVFAGLAGLMDPPREEAYAAVKACRTAGVRTVMITGDHEITARAIAERLGIISRGEKTLSGAALDNMSDSALAAALDDTAVFARVTPAHKLRIVRALKQKGEIVAMTGDGVNDAPALKEANIGVAMGKGGTDVTREAADVILLDDNFATLVAAVEEGRVIYQNIRRFLRYLLSCNIGEVLTMFGGMLLGMPVILTPIQLLLVNLVTDGLPAIALGMEKSDGEVMYDDPRKPDESVFSNGLLGKIVFRGILIGLATLFVFSLLIKKGATLETARTGALTALVMTQLFHVFECRSEEKSLFEIDPFGNPLLIGAALISALAVFAVVNVPLLSQAFGTAALTFGEFKFVLAVSAAAPICSGVAMLFSKGDKKKRRLR